MFAVLPARFRRLSLWLIVIAVCLAVPTLALAQEQPPTVVLRVATKSFPPLVNIQGQSFTGFSIEFWDAVAAEIGVEYTFYEVATVGDQLMAVQNGDADAAIAGITITELREEVIDFSFPYFDAGLQIMVRQEESSPITNALRAIFSPDMLGFLGVFALLILIIAHGIWWLERHKNPGITQSYPLGIAQAIWWSTVTAMGYDDHSPRTFLGRVLALLWMFAAIFIIANLTATLSAAATVRELRSSIRGISDLGGQRVAAPIGTTAAQYLQNGGIAFSATVNIDDAIALLTAGQTDAVVYDAPVLRDYIRSTGRTDLGLVGGVFAPERYGIALPEGSPYRELINRAILRMQEDGTYGRLYDRWFNVPSG
jgi:ABC-type amino acid transport substrate-binding protein